MLGCDSNCLLLSDILRIWCLQHLGMVLCGNYIIQGPRSTTHRCFNQSRTERLHDAASFFTSNATYFLFDNDVITRCAESQDRVPASTALQVAEVDNVKGTEATGWRTVEALNLVYEQAIRARFISWSRTRLRRWVSRQSPVFGRRSLRVRGSVRGEL
jgi:hypothetical protein